MDADLVFAASGCALAAQQALERELRVVAGASRPRVTVPLKEPEARDGLVNLALWLGSLRDRSDWVGNAFQRTMMAAKYLVRASSLPREHQRFLAFAQAHPLMRACVKCDPRLLERHLHRFINRHWHRAARLRSLQCHYRHMLHRLPTALFDDIYVRGRATLGQLTLKDGSQLALHLRPPVFMGCEGELCIELSEMDGRPFYRLVITIIDDEPTLAIGCLQGPDGEHARERVRELTRHMHGMRPKQLVLTLAYAFASRCGVRRIMAVGNAGHPLRGRRQFHADYDAFWQEQGGVQARGGWFLMPSTLPHRIESEVPSKHRALYRRRAELRRQAEQMLADAMGDAPAATVTLESKSSVPGVLREAAWTS
ncbi:VirK/YbjX family protein [Dyella humicola]|uniref:VirK/YbjX family protein n=1 Tax=Dyella humicola TaxID=2992126 RepID=UPI002256B940|nr:DUF535 family protein [Dyella humicola]